MGAASFAASKIKLISLVYDSRCVPKSERQLFAPVVANIMRASVPADVGMAYL